MIEDRGRSESEKHYNKISKDMFLLRVSGRMRTSLDFWNGLRELAEEDGLKVPSCNRCHNMGRVVEQIHGNVMAERLSKMLGQAIYEAKIGDRESFRQRYGKSFL